MVACFALTVCCTEPQRSEAFVLFAMCCLCKIPSPMVWQSSHFVLTISITWTELSNTHTLTCTLTANHTHRFLPLLLVLQWEKFTTEQNRTSVQSELPQFSLLLYFKSKKKYFCGLLLLIRFKGRCKCKNWSTEGLPPCHTGKCYPMFYPAILLSSKANPNETILHWHAGGLDSLIALFYL